MVGGRCSALPAATAQTASSTTAQGQADDYLPLLRDLSSGEPCRHHRDPFYCHLHRWKTERWLGERCAICSEHCKEGRPATTSAPQGQRAQGTQLECLASTDVSLLSLGEAALSSRTITPRQRHQGCRDSAGRGLCRSEICNSDLWPIHRKCGKRAERTRGSHGRRGRGDRRRSGYRVGTHFGLLRPISCQRSSCSHSQAKHRRRAHDTCSWCPSLSPQGAGPHARAVLRQSRPLPCLTGLGALRHTVSTGAAFRPPTPARLSVARFGEECSRGAGRHYDREWHCDSPRTPFREEARCQAGLSPFWHTSHYSHTCGGDHRCRCRRVGLGPGFQECQFRRRRYTGGVARSFPRLRDPGIKTLLLKRPLPVLCPSGELRSLAGPSFDELPFQVCALDSSSPFGQCVTFHREALLRTVPLPLRHDGAALYSFLYRIFAFFVCTGSTGFSLPGNDGFRNGCLPLPCVFAFLPCSGNLTWICSSSAWVDYCWILADPRLRLPGSVHRAARHADLLSWSLRFSPSFPLGFHLGYCRPSSVVCLPPDVPGCRISEECARRFCVMLPPHQAAFPFQHQWDRYSVVEGVPKSWIGGSGPTTPLECTPVLDGCCGANCAFCFGCMLAASGPIEASAREYCLHWLLFLYETFVAPLARSFLLLFFLSLIRLWICPGRLAPVKALSLESAEICRGKTGIWQDGSQHMCAQEVRDLLAHTQMHTSCKPSGPHKPQKIISCRLGLQDRFRMS